MNDLELRYDTLGSAMICLPKGFPKVEQDGQRDFRFESWRDHGQIVSFIANEKINTSHNFWGERKPPQWAAAARALQDYVSFPDEQDVTVNPQSFTAAIQVLDELYDLGIECPCPHFDSDGDATFLWERAQSVYTMTVTRDWLSLVVTRRGVLERATGELSTANGLPSEICQYLPKQETVLKAQHYKLLSSSLWNIFPMRTLSGDKYCSLIWHSAPPLISTKPSTFSQNTTVETPSIGLNMRHLMRPMSAA